ncbi:AsnC family transcriptional regulator [Microbacterium sp. Root61]|uniref:Lrp/AsnC family transcriptional regulator n=1 Tax=Microbacterium sp. Root61 TaxID=1736570 RepID=UPI0006F78143|nr:Lrp/AsnC family transcriptional regulator [Microbacterium sp. Root61]KRA23530.1 AsnC family transcriptional regulator [Microbacterium sp. Root61]
MDAIDDTILQILTEDGRTSFSALGTRVGLSTNAAAARVRRLETAGVIVGYRAVLAKEGPGAVDGIEAFIDVRLRPEQDSDAFMQWALGHPAVRDAVHVTGPYDYLVHVVVDSTADLDELLRRLKSSAGAGQTQTRLALRPHR